MIDFHNHVLPNVDDGPRTMEESISMVKEAANQGITDIIQTVHFQHPKMDKKNTSYNYLKSKIDEFQNEIDKLKIDVKIHLSAEVFYLPNLVEISSNPLLTVGRGKYMLIEFAANIFPTGYESQFYNLQLNGITPIVAHPERYRFVQNDIDINNAAKKLLVNSNKHNNLIQRNSNNIFGSLSNVTKDNNIVVNNNNMTSNQTLLQHQSQQQPSSTVDTATATAPPPQSATTTDTTTDTTTITTAGDTAVVKTNTFDYEKNGFFNGVISIWLYFGFIASVCRICCL